MSYPTIWLSNAAIDVMTAEAVTAAPNETGGMLLGWENDVRNETVIVDVTGPGPKARHSPSSFGPDGAWQQAELAAAYGRSGGVVTYLGDWHVHPNGGFNMSRRDRRTMAKIASDQDARCPRPLMVLLAWERNRYRLGVWMWEPTWIHPILGRAISMSLRSWEPSADENRLIGR